MNCREIADKLSACQDGALEPGAAEQIRLHLDSCAACRSEMDALSRLADTVRAEMSPIEPPESFARMVMARLPERKRSRIYRPIFVWSGVAAVLLAVCLLLNSRLPNSTENRPVVAANKPVTDVPEAQPKQPAVMEQAWVHHGGRPARKAPRQLAVRERPAPAPEIVRGVRPVVVRRDESENIAEAAPLEHSGVELARVPIGDDKPAEYRTITASRDNSEPRESKVRLVARSQGGGFLIGLVVE